MKGWRVVRAPDGYVVVTLMSSADPEKDTEEWLNQRRAEQPDDVAFRREFLLDWTSAEGNPFFPEFAEKASDYVQPHVVDPLKPVIRGWDFGRRKPACVWMQEQEGQVVVLYSLIGDDIDIHSFRDLVMFLSAEPMRVDLETTDVNLELEVLKGRPAALRHLREIMDRRPWWPEGDPDKIQYNVPILPPGLTFEDYSSYEAYQKQAFDTEAGEKSSAEVLSSRGIHIRWLQKPESYGDNIIRRLMLKMPDGRYGLSISPMAPDLIVGLGGALTYAPSTTANPRPDKVRDDNYYINVYDAFRYGVVNMADVGERVKAYRRDVATPAAPDKDERLEAKPKPRGGRWRGVNYNENWLD